MFDVETIIQTGGLLAICLIIFAESGILLGLFLPGDSLLLAAGWFASKGHLPNIWLDIVLIIIAAIIGYEVGYYFGKKAGPRVFNRSDGFLFRKEYMKSTAKFFDQYGGTTVIAARFIAHVRTFVSIIAGASSMDRRRYSIYNVLGAILWVAGLMLLGYWLGSSVPNFDRYIIIAVLISLVILYSYGLWQLLKTPDRRRGLRKGLREDWNYFFKSRGGG